MQGIKGRGTEKGNKNRPFFWAAALCPIWSESGTERNGRVYLLFHGAGEHLNALHVDGSLDSLLELLVLASFPTHADQTTTAGQDDQQRRHADTDRARVPDCMQHKSTLGKLFTCAYFGKVQNS